MKKVTNLKSKFIAMFFAICISFASFSNILAEEKDKLKETKDIKEVEIKENKSGAEGDDEKTEEKGIVNGDIYGGIVSKVMFTNNNEATEKSKLTTMMMGFVGYKGDYNVPNFPFPIKFDIKLAAGKTTFYDEKFKVNVPWAYIDIWKFKFGMAKSLFNPNNKPKPQLRFTYGFDSGIELAIAVEASKQDNYFDNDTKVYLDEEARKVKDKDLDKDDDENVISGYRYALKRLDWFPAMLSVQFKYKKEKLVTFTAAVLAKPILFVLEDSMTTDENEKDSVNASIAGGLNANLSVNPLEWTRLDFGLMVGRGCANEISDWTGNYTSDKEKNREFLFDVKKDEVTKKIEINKDGSPNLLYSIRASVGINQNFTKDFSCYVVYYLDLAGDDPSKFFKEHKIANNDQTDFDESTNGVPKSHQIKALFTYDFNAEGKVKFTFGPIFNFLDDTKNKNDMLQVFAQVLVSL